MPLAPGPDQPVSRRAFHQLIRLVVTQLAVLQRQDAFPYRLSSGQNYGWRPAQPPPSFLTILISVANTRCGP